MKIKQGSFIPFSGFSYTIYEQEIDYTFEREIEYYADEHETDISDYIYNLSSEFYRELYEKISIEFCTYLNSILYDEYNIDLDIKFKELISPRQYNFENDKILVELNKFDLYKIYKKIPSDILIKTIKDRHKSRDGFISFITHDIDQWNFKALSEHQAHTVLIAALINVDLYENLDTTFLIENEISETISNYMPHWLDEIEKDKIKCA